MKISELAKATGLNPRTIRFYEAMELLPRPGRTPAGYRIYGERDRDRLAFIRKAQRLGLSLAEVRSVLALADRSRPTCIHVRAILDDKLVEAERAIRDLTEFRATLQSMRARLQDLEDCRPAGGRICSVIEQMEAGPPATVLTETQHARIRGSIKKRTMRR
jgi:DNA-binding transcriptional MerR regulator